MSQILVILGFVVLFSGMRIGAVCGSTERRVLLSGVALTLALASGAVLFSPSLVEFLSVSPPTFWVAAGFVVTAMGVAGLVRGAPKPWGSASTRPSTFVPLVFPVLLTPDLIMHSLASGLEYRMSSIVGLIIAAGIVVLVATFEIPTRLVAPLVRMHGAAAIVLGIVWVVEGTRGLLL